MPMINQHSPWGRIEECREIAPGLFHIATASHGGYFLAPAVNAVVPPYFRDASFCRQGHDGWYEEDCDWAIVATVFPGAFPAAAQDDARRMLGRTGALINEALVRWDLR